MKWTFPHIASAVFWCLWVVNFALPLPGIAAPAISLLGAVIMLVHVIEVFVFWRRIDAAGDPVSHVIRILLFGIFHARTLPKVN